MNLTPPVENPQAADTRQNREPVAAWLAELPGLVAELGCDELNDIARLTQEINALEKRIVKHARVYAKHVLAPPGCG